MPDPLLTLIRKESERGRDPNSTYASNIEKIRLTNMLESLHGGKYYRENEQHRAGQAPIGASEDGKEV